MVVQMFNGSVLAIMGESDVLQDTPDCAQWLRQVLRKSKSRLQLLEEGDLESTPLPKNACAGPTRW